MFLLDTNVISELRKAGGGSADENVVRWVSARDAGSFYLSVITLMEIEIGILRIERRDAVQGAKLRAWMSGRLLTEFSRRILHVDTEVALLCARLHVPDPKAERDAFIAGIAMVHGFTLVTRNISDFQATGVPLLNPWDGLLA